MAGLVELLGESLQSKDGEVKTADALSGKGAIALYFSAHWCPPCRGFTPQFAGWYTETLKAKGLEVIFVSSDRDEGAFKEYFGEQPWLALPYADRDRKESLSKKFKVQGIPTVTILDGEGKVINADGRSAVSGDPTGENFPWKPQTLQDVLAGAKLVGQDGTTQDASTLSGKVFGLYFSAHWCPPCRGFTPQLADWYTKDLKAKGFEIVFVSSDKDEAAFKDYFKEQPWLALEFSDRKRKGQLSDVLGVQGIPSFAIIDTDGSVITKDGRSAVSGDKTGENFPWYPKPVTNMAGGPGSLNEVPTVIAFCETSDAAAKKAAEAAMTPIAKRLREEAKAKGEDEPEVGFAICTEASGLSARLRSMFSLKTLPPMKHEHPLKKQEATGGWGCDGCSSSGEGKERYRCCEGCDFDFCGECYAKAEAGTTEVLPAKLMLVDIPDSGGYYAGPDGDITEAVVNKFLEDYKAKALTRKQLE